MKNTGQILKNKRESLNLTLSEVALATKINPKVLTAMEAGDSGNLPAQTFLKGFVRSYANFLKLDVDQIMRAFNEEMGTQPVVMAPPASEKSQDVVKPVTKAAAAPSNLGSGMPSTSTMKSIAVGGIVVLIGVIFGVRELIEKYQKETVVEQPTDLKATPIVQEENAESGEPTAVEKSEEAKLAEEKASTEANKANEAEAQKVLETAKAADAAKAAEAAKLTAAKAAEEAKVAEAKAAEEAKKAAAKAAEEAKIAEAKAAEEAKKAAEAAKVAEAAKAAQAKAAADAAKVAEAAKAAEVAKAKAAETSTASATPAVTTAETKLTKNEIILEALDKVEVKFNVKGETKKLSMAPTQVHTIRTDGPVQFDFSDGGAINIIYNGRERGVPGDLGKPTQVKIP